MNAFVLVLTSALACAPAHAAQTRAMAPELGLPTAAAGLGAPSAAASAGPAAAPDVHATLSAAEFAATAVSPQSISGQALPAAAAEPDQSASRLTLRAQDLARALGGLPEPEAAPQAEDSDYLKVVDGQSVGVPRIETIFGRPVRVLDVSGYVNESRAKSQPELKVITVEEAFARPKAFLGFGLPNVYLSIPGAEGLHKIDAKSLKRADTKVVATKGRVQSGVLVVLKDLDDATLARMMEVAKTHEGGRELTCVHANCLAMGDMGFTVGGRSLSEYYFPSPLLAAILEHGLELHGRPVAFDVVRTTPQDLEAFRASIDVAVKTTPWRHLQRAFPGAAAATLEDAAPAAPAESALTRYPVGAPRTADLSMTVSRPSGFGMVLRKLWGPHLLYRVEQRRVDVDAYLPETMKSFPQEHPSLATRLKKRLLFSRPVVALLRRHLARGFETFEGQSEGDLFDMMRTHSEQVPNKYNFVVDGAAFSLMNIDGGSRFRRAAAKLADWILSKHVLMSGYSEDVRFAGEVWKGADGRVYVSNNSGTYQPSPAQLANAVAYLRAVFPGVAFVAVDASAPAK